MIETISSLSLRRTMLYKVGQDLRRCRGCGVCSEFVFPYDEIDLALGTVIQLVLLNDPEVFTCRTLWSDVVMEETEMLCPNGIDLTAVLQTLRKEAVLRGFSKS